MIINPMPIATGVSRAQVYYLRKLVYRQTLVWEGRLDPALDVTLELRELERGMKAEGLSVLLELLSGK